MVSIPVEHDKKIIYLVVLGLGAKKNKKLAVENYRRALASAVRFAQKNKIETLAFQLPEARLFGVSDEYLAQETATVGVMTRYAFDTFKKSEDTVGAITVNVILNDHDAKKIKTGLTRGEQIGAAVNNARQWVNLPANIMHPAELALQARELAKKYDFYCRVFSEKEIQDMGMGGLAAVSSGSEQDCCLIVMEYKTSKKMRQHLLLWAKALHTILAV